MNERWVLFHLEEAMEELMVTARHLRCDGAYEEQDFRVALEHVYHHLNFAWNARNLTPGEVNRIDDDAFGRYRAFPADIGLGGESPGM